MTKTNKQESFLRSRQKKRDRYKIKGQDKQNTVG